MLIIPDYLSTADCTRIRTAMDAGCPEPAEILEQDGIVGDDQIRRALHVEVDEETLRFVEQRLDAARERIAGHFGLALGQREGASLLRYLPGGLFAPHRDRGDVAAWPGAARRRIAVVVFLATSREADPMGTFSGGALRILEGEAGLLSQPIDLHPQAGTLVAFPATVLHEVTAVRDGIRDAVVDWYYQAAD